MDDLDDWEDDDWDRWVTSCKKRDKVLNAWNLIEQQVFQPTVKPPKRLKRASSLVRYYESVSIPLTCMNMMLDIGYLYPRPRVRGRILIEVWCPPTGPQGARRHGRSAFGPPAQ